MKFANSLRTPFFTEHFLVPASENNEQQQLSESFLLQELINGFAIWQAL